MDLRTWLEENKVTLRELAVKLGVTTQYVWSIAVGRTVPSEALCKRIVESTDGIVSLQDLPKRYNNKPVKAKRDYLIKILSIQFDHKLIEEVDYLIKGKIGVCRTSWIVESMREKLAREKS